MRRKGMETGEEKRRNNKGKGMRRAVQIRRNGEGEERLGKD